MYAAKVSMGRTVLAVSFFLAAVAPAIAQQPSDQNGSSSQAAGANAQSQDQDNSAPVAPLVVTDTNAVHEVGQAQALTETISPLRWGPLYVASGQFSQVYEHLTGFNGTLSTSEPISTFRTTVVFDKEFEQSRIALQYSPNLTIASGQVYTNFTSQLASLNLRRDLSARWSFGVSDSFSDYQNQNLLVDNYFSMDTLNHSTLQQPFVSYAGRILTNNVQMNAIYRLAPQTSLSFTPTYTYSVSTAPSATTTGNQYGGSLALNQTIARGDTFGFSYAYQLSQVAGQRSTNYHSGGISYSRQLTQNLSAAAGVSAVWVNLGGPASSSNWTTGGFLQLIRSFSRSSIAIAYARTQGFSQVITSGTTDRVDGSYRVRFTPRFSSNLGGGYFRTIAQTQHYLGKYATGSITYLLSPSLSLSATYSHGFQSGSVAQLLSGTSNIVVGGITWAPKVLP